VGGLLERLGKSKWGATALDCGRGCTFFALQKNSKHGFAEKVRRGKNLNSWDGLSVGFLSFVTELSSCTEQSKV
jgi:hypothetical protein